MRAGTGKGNGDIEDIVSVGQSEVVAEIEVRW